MEVIDLAADPVPPDEVRREFLDYMRSNGFDLDAEDFTVEYADYIGTFDGVVRTIKITVLTLPDGSTYQWFPELPDAARRRPKP
jgi:hypothetical protein